MTLLILAQINCDAVTNMGWLCRCQSHWRGSWSDSLDLNPFNINAEEQSNRLLLLCGHLFQWKKNSRCPAQQQSKAQIITSSTATAFSEPWRSWVTWIGFWGICNSAKLYMYIEPSKNLATTHCICNGVFLEKTHYSLATKSHSGFAFQFEAHAVSCMASILQFGTSILWIYIILSYIYMDLFVKTSYSFYWWLLTTSRIVLVMNLLSRLLTPCIASVESECITWRWWAAMVSEAWKTLSPYRRVGPPKYRRMIDIVGDTGRRRRASTNTTCALYQRRITD